MVTISLGVPGNERSSSTVPPASKRYCTVISTGPCPMSAVPCHVPTSVFKRSNSGEPFFTVFSGSPAPASTPPATNKTAHNVVSFFIFVSLSIFQRTTIGIQDNEFKKKCGSANRLQWNRFLKQERVQQT